MPRYLAVNPFIENIEGGLAGGKNGLINCAGDEIYILCFSCTAYFLVDATVLAANCTTFIGGISEVVREMPALSNGKRGPLLDLLWNGRDDDADAAADEDDLVVLLGFH